MKRLIFILLILACGCAQGKSFKDWLCEFLGIRSGYYDKATQVRSGIQWGTGNELVRYNLETKSETVVWTATGLCSPAKVSETEIAVIRREGDGRVKENEAGLWLVTLAGPSPEAKQVTADKMLLAILGSVATHPRKLLIASTVGQGRKLSETDVDSKTVSAPQNLPPLDLNLVETMLPSGAFRGDRFLAASKQKEVFRLTVTDLSKWPKDYSKFVGPSEQEDTRFKDSFDRIDPIWLDDQNIIYIRKNIQTK